MTERTRSFVVSAAVIVVIVLALLLWLDSIGVAREFVRNLGS